jgi:ferrous-iron efflux pump FieF
MTGWAKRSKKAKLKAEDAAFIAASSALLLALTKAGLFFWTGSLVVAVSAWDSCMDFVVSMVNRKTLAFARLVPDAGHPYGHGKAESIAGLGQGALLMGGAVTIAVAALESIWRSSSSPVEITGTIWFTVLFFLAAALASLGITTLLDRYGAIHNSPALKADAEHYRGDVFANLGSAAGLTLVSLTEISWMDPALAALFALKIAHSGYTLMRQSVHELMDHDIGQETKNTVELFARQIVPEIIDLHRFRGRQSGPRLLIDFHVTLPSTLSFSDVHQHVEDLEEALKREFNADVVIHADPG